MVSSPLWHLIITSKHTLGPIARSEVSHASGFGDEALGIQFDSDPGGDFIFKIYVQLSDIDIS